ncbi:MAG: hypothetical protein ACI85O_002679 [Saprospiraceae bacterium]|jgi:hypothetical protein
MKITIFAFFLSLNLAFTMSHSLHAQTDSTLEVHGKILGNIHFYTTDRLCNIYLINDNYEVVKYTPSGQETYRYSNTRLDRPTFIDATDPFNILVFYPDYQTIILLDRTMTHTATLNFSDFDFFNVNAVAFSSDNKLWVYDELNFRLKKIDRNGKTIQESDDLSLLLDSDFKPNFLVERELKVFVNDPNVGILVFDAFGQYVKRLDFRGLADFQVSRNLLIFRDEKNEAQIFHLNSLLTSPTNLPSNVPSGKIQYQTGFLYAQDEEGVFIFRL